MLVHPVTSPWQNARSIYCSRSLGRSTH
jgi:hypothetical protein